MKSFYQEIIGHLEVLHKQQADAKALYENEKDPYLKDILLDRMWWLKKLEQDYKEAIKSPIINNQLN